MKMQFMLEDTPTWNLPNGCKWDFTATDMYLTKVQTCDESAYVEGEEEIRRVWKANRKTGEMVMSRTFFSEISNKVITYDYEYTCVKAEDVPNKF